MNNQDYPGQTYQPGANTNTDQSSQTSDEISAIDTAVQQNPQPSDATPTAAEDTTSPAPQPDNTASQTPAEEATDRTETPQPEAAEASPQQQDDAKENDDELLLSWEAAEPAQMDEQTKLMTLGVIGLAALIIIALFLFDGINFGTILGTIVVALGVVALLIASRQHGHFQSYAIYSSGVSVGNKFYPFDQLRAFSVVSSGGAASIELEPVQRFMVRIVMHLEASTGEQAVSLLARNLPHKERNSGILNRSGE